MPATADARYDLIIIGSGPGGGAVAWRLAATGKRILILERGGYLPRSRDNWDTREVFTKARYQAKETWTAANGEEFHPGLHYFVGGNSKVYGAALFRLRTSDFGAVRHEDGISPAWPLGYEALAPCYQLAEDLYRIRGLRGDDPTEPPADRPYPCPPVEHEPRIAALSDNLRRLGHRPFHLPMAVLLDQDAAGDALPDSTCIRCDHCDGYPCPVNAKADAQVVCVDPTLHDHPNVTMMTHAFADRLLTDAPGGSVTGVEVVIGDGEAAIRRMFAADVVVVACGALSSALLMLRSGNAAHPDGLGNASGLVGRNYMRHNNSIVLAVSRTPNPTRFQKTLGLNDFYHAPENGGMGEWDYPLGHIQMVGKSDGAQIEAEALPGFLQRFPEAPFGWIARHSIDFWLQSEDLPLPQNRISYSGGRVRLDLTPTNAQAHRRLRAALRRILDHVDIHPHLFDRTLYFGQDVPIGGTAHQAGTMRFGPDPASAVLDLDCKVHGIDNLYVADASFFPSIGAVNPTLTIIANAIRVADRIGERLVA
ncbi:dehydrogenase [Paracoccus sp. S-4012]|uniref:GMC oxidoreductase n=1 Tax=Paracoccus sp. S-4012 TaxID=2665648 RepID=UPI0012B1488B|nr:GMC family oxidoreductase [Paracoccus sp. S-4012]MRX49935.1 dehydrogenase [Paracoccus sp. S-4012]